MRAVTHGAMSSRRAGALGRLVQSAVIISMIATMFVAAPPQRALANQVGSSATNTMTVYDTDFVSAGFGGMRGNGVGTITLAGVSGTITKALLYWHGPTNSADPTVNAAVTFADHSVTGTNIGSSGDNCWGFTNSQAYRADVTSFVSVATTSYSLSNFTKTPEEITTAEINGVSLLVFFDDGNPANNRDIVLLDGNDSNTTNTSDAAGWSATLSGINYSSGSASLQFHVSDGQHGASFTDAPVIYTPTGGDSATLATPDESGEIFRGDSVPRASADSTNGGLWDIKTFDITLSPGLNGFTITTDYLQDCLSLVVLAVNLPAGAAPRPPLTGVAQCKTQGDGVITTNLPGALVELFSGSVLVAHTQAAEDASFSFSGLAPNATYSLRYTGTAFEQDFVCGATATTDARGGGTAVAVVTSPDPGNTNWVQALLVPSGANNVSSLTSLRSERWYAFQVPADAQVTVTLNGPSAYGVALFDDLGKISELLRSADPAAAAAAINSVAAAPLGATPLGATPLGATPLGATPLGATPLGATPLGATPLGATPLGATPLGATPLGATPLGATPLGATPLGATPLGATLYMASQIVGLLSFSSGTESPKLLLRNSYGRSGYFYARVYAVNGAIDPATVFTLTAVILPGACDALPPATSLSWVGAGVPTATPMSVLLTNTARVKHQDGTALTTAQALTFLNRLSALALRTEVNGIVVDLAGSASPAAAGPLPANVRLVDGVMPTYGYWDGQLTCAPAANVVADKIHDVVVAYRATTPSALKYVVLVGSDHVIPYQRVPDHAELMNENLFDVPVKDPSVSLAALARGYVPTQDFYGSFQSIRRFDHDLQVPDVAVGRLVESVEDINSYLDAYGSLTTPGVVTLAPSSAALATGYSFLSDLADFMKTNLDGAGLTTRKLNDPPTTWSADDLRAQLGLPITGATTQPPVTHFGVIALNGHFSPNEMLAADYASTINANEIAGLAPSDTRFRNTLILSIGCHSGYNVVRADAVAGRTQELDFAQAFAQQGATLVAPTTFGYGDTDFIGYTERLLANVALELRYGTQPNGSGAVPIGGALVRAKRAYLDQIVSLSGADEKALSSLTVFGLPMLSYDLPTGPGNRLIRPGASAPLTLTAGPQGLSTADVTPPYSLHLQQKTLTTVNPNGTTGPTVTESYYDANGDVLAIPFRPVMPRVTQSLASTPAGAQPRGAVLLSASYFDTPGFQPLLDVPATEIPALHPTFVTGVFSPQPQSTLNTVNAPPKLMVVPFQYRSNGNAPTGTARVYAVHGPNNTLTPSMNFRVYYSTSTDPALTLAGPPAILSTTMTTADGSSPSSLVHVEVTVAGSNTNALADLFVTFTAENTTPTSSFYGQWSSCSLVTGAVTGAGACTNTSFDDLSNGSTQSFIRRYKADLTTGGGLPGALRLFVQAVGASGAAALDNAGGAYFRVTPATATAGQPKAVTKLVLGSAPTTVAYGSVVHASATLTDAAGAPLSDGAGHRLHLPVTLALGSSTATLTTDDDGKVSADLIVRDDPRSAPYDLTASFSEDETHLGTTAVAAITIEKATTSIVISGTVQYSDHGFLGTLRAIYPSLPDAVLNEQRIVIDVADVPATPFTPDAPAHTFTRSTDGFGRIFVDSLSDNVAPTTLTLTYAGNARYKATSGTATINPENATVTFVAVPQGQTVAGTVTQEADGSAGDLSRAIVTFSIDGSASVSAGVASDGSVSATLSSPLPAGVHTVSATIGGFFTGAGTGVVPVFDPTKSVAAAGSVPAPNNQRATFAFAVKYLNAPVVTAANATGGALAPGTYRVGYSYGRIFGGETAIGAAAAATLAGANKAIAVARITGVPIGVTSLRFYFTAAPAGKPTGFVIQRPVQSGAVAAFTILAGPTVSTPAVSAPTGALGLLVTDNATKKLKATFLVPGTPGGFDWLVITGSPSSHAIFEGTGTFIDASGSTKRHFRVTVDKPSNFFEIRIADPAHPTTPLVISGTVTPLPLDDDPARSGIVFR